MKKLLNLLLAAAMVLSLSTTALASTGPNFSAEGIWRPKYLYGGYAEYICRPKGADIEMDYWLVYDGILPAEYGSTVMLELLHAGETWSGFSLDMIRNMRVKAEWEEGGDLVESVAVTVVRSMSYYPEYNGYNVYDDEEWDDEEEWEDEYYYFPALVIKLKDSTATSDADVIGKVTLNKSKGPAGYRIKDGEIQVQFGVDHGRSYLQYPEALVVVEDTQFIAPGAPYLLKFDYDDEVELSFGQAPNEGTFTVDVSGQGKLLLLFDSQPNEAVAAANPAARLTFFGFNGAKFNRTGEMFYESETGRYIYELVDGMPVAIPGAEYDEDDEGFRFYTRTLGRYVISDIELVQPDPEAAKAAVISGTDLHNQVANYYFYPKG